MSRIEPELVNDYRKDDGEEAFLELLNSRLGPLDETFYIEVDAPPPSIFVLGPPRSGTTLISQVITSYFKVGCVSNLMAAFWQAPICGLRLTAKLSNEPLSSSFNSDYARTTGLFEPHEFGYFWSEVLHYGELAKNANVALEPKDWEKLATILNNISHVYGGPFLHKNILCNWHAAKLAQLLPNAIFVVASRDQIDTASSLLGMRQNMLGDWQKWMSAKPAAFDFLEAMDVYHQVVGQVYFLQQELDEQLEQISSDRVLRVDLQEFCDGTEQFLRRLESMVSSRSGTSLLSRGVELPSFSYRESTESEAILRQKLEAALRNLIAMDREK